MQRKKLKIHEVSCNQKTLLELHLEACKSNNLEKVVASITLGVDVNSVSEDGEESGLTVAADKGYLQLLEFLLNQPKINVNIKVKHPLYGQWTPLIFACRHGEPEIVRRLVQVPGLETDHQDSNGSKAQHYAAEYSAECVRALADMNTTVNWNIKNKYGETPLFDAIIDGNTEAVRIIASQPGIDFSIKNNGGTSLAECAVRFGNVETLKILVEAKQINWNEVDQFGHTPLMMTLKGNTKRNKEMFEVLVSHPEVDLNIRDSDGETVLTWAQRNMRQDQLDKILINHQVILSRSTHSIEDESSGDLKMTGSSQDVPDPSASLEATHPPDIEHGITSGSVSQVEKRRIHSIEDESSGDEETRPAAHTPDRSSVSQVKEITDLNKDCMEMIFSKLEFEDLMSAELTCEAWKRIIDGR